MGAVRQFQEAGAVVVVLPKQQAKGPPTASLAMSCRLVNGASRTMRRAGWPAAKLSPVRAPQGDAENIEPFVEDGRLGLKQSAKGAEGPLGRGLDGVGEGFPWQLPYPG